MALLIKLLLFDLELGLQLGDARLHFVVELLLNIFYFAAERHVSVIKHVLCRRLELFSAAILINAEATSRLLAARVQSLEQSFIHLALLLLSLLRLTHLHVEQLDLLLHERDLLLVLLLLGAELASNAMHLLEALVASFLQSLVNFVFVWVWHRPETQHGARRRNRALTTLKAAHLRNTRHVVSCVLLALVHMRLGCLRQ